MAISPRKGSLSMKNNALKGLRGRLLGLALLAGPGTLFQSCATDIRDAALAGVFDYITGSVTETLSTALPLPGLFFGGDDAGAE